MGHHPVDRPVKVQGKDKSHSVHRSFRPAVIFPMFPGRVPYMVDDLPFQSRRAQTVLKLFFGCFRYVCKVNEPRLLQCQCSQYRIVAATNKSIGPI